MFFLAGTIFGYKEEKELKNRNDTGFMKKGEMEDGNG